MPKGDLMVITQMITCAYNVNSLHKIRILEVFNTIDFVVDGVKRPIFQTCEKEKGKIVFQLVKVISLKKCFVSNELLFKFNF